MLAFFRQRGLSSVLYGAIILATILTFVIEFRPNASQRTASLSETCVARVRGRCIDPKDFGAAYRILMPSRSADLSRRMNLKRVALDGLIERELLDDEASRLRIAVTEDEVTDQLYDGFVRVSVPAADPTVLQTVLQQMYQSYARGGLISQDVAQAHFNDRDAAIPVDFHDSKTKAFDMKTYERQIRNISNRSPTEFREQQSRELLAAKMRGIVRDPIRVSSSEAWHEYDRRYTTATVTWILVKETWAARWAVDAKPGDVDAWIKEHQTEFDKAFEERKQDDAPKSGHIRHILIKLPYGASDDEKALALAKASWVNSRIRSGEPFAEVARDASDDAASAAQGGDVGEKTDGFVAPFKAAADALRPGEITAGAIETQFGYHLIARDDPSMSAELEGQLKRSLAHTLYAKAKATDAARSVAARIGDLLRGGVGAQDAVNEAIAPFVRTTKTESLRVLHTGSEKRGADAGPDDLAPASVPRAPGPGSAKSTASGGPAIAATRFDASTDGDRPQPQTSSAFNRGGDAFPGLSPEGTARVASFAFEAKEGDVQTEPVRTEDGFVVTQLKQRKVATRDEFDKDRDALEAELLRAKRDEALALYVRRLRANAKDAIKIDESFVQEARTDAGAAGTDEDEDQY
jgi:peptidyl-prolyl cis-trans isomerase D